MKMITTFLFWEFVSVLMQSNFYFKLTDATLTFTSDYSFIDLFEQFAHACLHVLILFLCIIEIEIIHTVSI